MFHSSQVTGSGLDQNVFSMVTPLRISIITVSKLHVCKDKKPIDILRILPVHQGLAWYQASPQAASRPDLADT